MKTIAIVGNGSVGTNTREIIEMTLRSTDNIDFQVLGTDESTEGADIYINCIEEAEMFSSALSLSDLYEVSDKIDFIQPRYSRFYNEKHDFFNRKTKKRGQGKLKYLK